MATPASATWMDQPWTPAWLSFNLGPARWVHPARRAGLLPEAVAGWLEAGGTVGACRQVERQWSAMLLSTPEMAPVEQFDDPVLPLALLDEATLARLALWCGVVVAAPSICRVIARDDVTLLAAGLGEEGLRFARQVAPALRPGGAMQRDLPASEVMAGATDIGMALLSLAFDHGTAPVRARARLRLPPELGDAKGELPPDLLDGQAALTLARQVLLEIDPEWLSSFPTPR